MQNSLRETRSQPASQPAAAKRTRAKAQRETERKIKAHFGFGLQEGRPTSVTGPTYRKPKWVIVSFHFPSTRYPSGPAKDNTCLPSYTDQRSCNCKAKKNAKQMGKKGKQFTASFLQGFWGRRGFLTPHNCSFPTHHKQTLQNSMACHNL